MLLTLVLAVSVFAAEPKKVDLSDDVKLATYFVNTPIDELPPAGIPEMMKLDPKKLPEKLRKKVEARQLEMHTLKHLAATNKRGMVRTPEKECEIPKDGRSDDAKALLAANYEEINDDELQAVQKKTNCTTRELMCEFTLQVVLVRDKKDKVVGSRMFLHTADLAFLFVKVYREKGGAGNTNFFSKPVGYCTH